MSRKSGGEQTGADLGHNLLGPIFYRFCYQLWLHQLSQRNNDAAALFLSRGGLRLRHFYELFLTGNRLEPPCPLADFYVSRMATFKAGVIDHFDDFGPQIVNEYAWEPTLKAMEMLLPADIFLDWRNTLDVDRLREYETRRFDLPFLQTLLANEQAGSGAIKSYLTNQAGMLREHLTDVLQGRREALLVDTGWSGSIMQALGSVCEDVPMTGHFFGRYNYGQAQQPWFSNLIGLEVEGHDYTPLRPITGLFLYRHLIEGLCEVRWPSVEGYERQKPDGKIVPTTGLLLADRRVPDTSEPIAQGVADYIRSCPSGTRAAEIHRQADRATRKLHRLICFPARKDVAPMTVASRSADFGKDLDVPVTLDPAPPMALRQKMRNVRNALWPQGQAALEFPLVHPIVQATFLSRPSVNVLTRIASRLGLTRRSH